MNNSETSVENLGRSVQRYRSAVTRLLVLAAVIVIASLILFNQVDTRFVWGLATLVPIVPVLFVCVRRRKRASELLNILEEWGSKEVKRERDFPYIRKLHDMTVREEDDAIDDQTWRDLEMDRVFARIDRTFTAPGQAVLFRWLRHQLTSPEELKERDRQIEAIRSDIGTRSTLQLVLKSLNRVSGDELIAELLWSGDIAGTGFRHIFTILSILAGVSLLIPVVFWSWILVFVPIGMFCINVMVYTFVRRKKKLESVHFPYLVKMIKTARHLSRIESPGLAGYSSRLRELYRATRSISRKTRFMFPDYATASEPVSALLMQYLSVFFLLEVQAFYGSASEIAKRREDLKELYLAIGELDALQSTGSYRASLPVWSKPVLGGREIHVEIVNSRQPLLDDPVPAAISPGSNVMIITGSNMGGKSTFLRNIGCNALMAQTIATTLAESYRGPLFRIITSISRTDDLSAGKSYYYVEAERLLRAISAAASPEPTLCLIDELLSGTNSTERLQASEAIIRYLSKQNTLAIIATHDAELIEKMQETCDLYHFSGTVDENGLKFDYRLTPGVSHTKNAIALLRYMGFPEEITGGE